MLKLKVSYGCHYEQTADNTRHHIIQAIDWQYYYAAQETLAEV